ncbi:hypothetical protein [Nonomuraea sp. NEAU-A123]|uniref:hypothetical protein n=1 Tax=Nonomuraea sp. NEAU-A123 TaxID=2839649 RepID=UPI001BE45500|nr:hypothetical protein [Nonomuraea sp. NEAU-A123]MBT2229141.1 hypothetical protein [Nonomuraea sp. NEAU-A123]
MPRARRTKRDNSPASGKKSPERKPSEPVEEGAGGARPGRAVLAWVAGIVGAVIVAAVGAVFTGWFGSLGPGAFDEISREAPVTAAYVKTITDGPDLALREPVTAAQDRAILLGRPDAAQHEAFLERYRAAPVGETRVIVVLNGNRAGLRIADIRPRIVTREPVPDGALLSPAHAGEQGTIEVAADLDRPTPRFTSVKDRDTPYFETKQIDLVRDERVTFIMTLTACKAYYEFELVATVISNGRAEQVVIRSPGGLPFRLTGPARAYRTVYDESSMGGWSVRSKPGKYRIEGC